jgi:hypothetical protein
MENKKMKIIDRIALNRMFVLIGNLIKDIIQMFMKKEKNPLEPIPDTPKPRFPWLRNILDRNKK